MNAIKIAYYPVKSMQQGISEAEVYQRFAETGNVEFKKRKILNKLVNNEENKFRVLLSVQQNPHQTGRKLSENLDLNRTPTYNI